MMFFNYVETFLYPVVVYKPAFHISSSMYVPISLFFNFCPPRFPQYLTSNEIILFTIVNVKQACESFRGKKEILEISTTQIAFIQPPRITFKSFVVDSFIV